jgi:Fe-S cluster assembly scaffold protein SufB
MKTNILPAYTFNRLKMNYAEIDYEPADIKKTAISEDSFIDLKTAEDVAFDIEVAEGEERSVIMDLASEGTLNLSSKINIKAGASLKLVQVYGGDSKGRVINSIEGDVDKEGKIHIVQLLPGRGDCYTDCRIELKGDKSSAYIDMAYLTKGGQKHDSNYVVNHRGKETVSDIRTDGALKDGAEKTMRQTIDFKTGASGSTGKENEKVLLLGEDIVNKSIPLILCTEEDVQGNHGAAIGSLDEEMLFYLESRGISKEEGERLMTYANFGRLLPFIDDEKYREKIEELLAEEL